MEMMKPHDLDSVICSDQYLASEAANKFDNADISSLLAVAHTNPLTKSVIGLLLPFPKNPETSGPTGWYLELNYNYQIACWASVLTLLCVFRRNKNPYLFTLNERRWQWGEYGSVISFEEALDVQFGSTVPEGVRTMLRRFYEAGFELDFDDVANEFEPIPANIKQTLVCFFQIGRQQRIQHLIERQKWP